jgi:hypothetical protein
MKWIFQRGRFVIRFKYMHLVFSINDLKISNMIKVYKQIDYHHACKSIRNFDAHLHMRHNTVLNAFGKKYIRFNYIL